MQQIPSDTTNIRAPLIKILLPILSRLISFRCFISIPFISDVIGGASIQIEFVFLY